MLGLGSGEELAKEFSLEEEHSSQFGGGVASPVHTDTEVEEALCRICRCGSDGDRKLFHPCICTGSIRYVHEDCLMEWLSRIGSKSKSKCELCGHQFGFLPVYSPNTPKSLSGLEMFGIFLAWLVRQTPYALRLILVAFSWGVFVPQVSCILFRSLSLGSSHLSRSPERAQFGFTYNCILDWYEVAFGDDKFSCWCTGVAVTAAIISSFLVLLVISEFVNGWDEINAEIEEARAAGQDIDRAAQEEILDQNDIEFDEDIPDMNLALDGFFGLQGSLIHLVYHILGMIFLNGLYLFCMYYIPTRVGSFVIRHAHEAFVAVTGIQLLSRSDTLFLQGKPLEGFTPRTDAEFVPLEAPLGLCGVDDLQTEATQVFWQSVYTCALQISCFGMGLGLFVAILVVGQDLARLLSIYSVRRGTKTVWKSVGAILQTAISTIKVAVLVVLKMGVFPVGLGMFLELCCRPMFAFTLAQRLSFVLERPLYSLIIFWVAGITHMLVITVLVVQLREILHKDVLKGIIRAHDPNVNLFRILLVEPFSHHLRRMVISCTIYTVLIVLFVRLPLTVVTELKLLDGLAWYPLHPKFSYYSIEIQLPLELAGFHFMALHLLDYTKPWVLAAQSMFLKGTCKVVGLTRYLLPCKQTAVVEEGQEPELLPREVPDYLPLRILALLVASWLVCLVSILSISTAPFITGMQLREMLKLPIVHPPHVYFLGCFVIWRLVIFGCGVSFFLRNRLTRPTIRSMDKFLHWVQWTLLCCMVLGILPCLLGMLAQVVFLLPADRPVMAYPQIPSLSGFADIMVEYVSAITENGSDSTFLVNEWMMGVVILFAAQQIVNNTELSAKLGNGVYQFHVKFKAALEDMRNHDCTAMLHTVVSAAVTSILLHLFSSSVLTYVTEYLAYSVVGYSLCGTYGIAPMMRWAIVVIACIRCSPYFVESGRRRLTQVHDALRDYKYLAGRQLMNMEKRYSRKKRIKKRDVM